MKIIALFILAILLVSCEKDLQYGGSYQVQPRPTIGFQPGAFWYDTAVLWSQRYQWDPYQRTHYIKPWQIDGEVVFNYVAWTTITDSMQFAADSLQPLADDFYAFTGRYCRSFTFVIRQPVDWHLQPRPWPGMNFNYDTDTTTIIYNY